MRELASRQLRPLQLVIGLIIALVVGAALISGIGHLVGFADLRRAVSGADYRWLAVCFVGQVAVFTGYAATLRHAFASEDGVPLPPVWSFRLVLASFAATQVFTFGGIGGLAILYWAFRRVGHGREQAAIRLIGLNAAVYLVFGAIGWSAAAWALLTSEAPLSLTLPWLIAFPAVMMAARWFTAPARVARWTARTGRRVRRALATGVGAAAWVRRAVGSTEDRPLFAWAALYWIGDIASMWAALRAVGAQPGLPAVVAAYTTGYLVQSLPIPLIATSGVDAATTFLLRALGVPLDLALVGIVAHRLFAFWLPVLPGSVFAWSLPRMGRSLAAATRVHAAQPTRVPADDDSMTESS